MNKLIFLTGTIDSSFFMNEIDYMIKHFDEVIVLTYPVNKNLSGETKANGFKHYIIENDIVKNLFNINFYSWLFSKATRDEVKANFSFNKKGMKKILYLISYGINYINGKRIIDKILKENTNSNICLYSYWLSRNAYVLANYNINRKSNIGKILSRAHRYDLYEERNSVNYLPFRNFINGNLDEIYFISIDGLKYFTDKYDIEIGLGKSVSRLGTFNANGQTKQILPKGKICIASCSNIIDVKRLDLIVDVISNLKVSVEWIHLGVGVQMKQIESYAAQKIKKNTYKFLGQVDNKEILNIYKKYDVDFFINLSDSEGVPVSIMEAMSVGIPTITRNVGGNEEIVNNKSGLLIEDVNNKENLYMQINNIVKERIDDLEEYDAKSKEAMKIWCLKYNADHNYDEFYENIKCNLVNISK